MRLVPANKGDSPIVPHNKGVSGNRSVFVNQSVSISVTAKGAGEGLVERIGIPRCARYDRSFATLRIAYPHRGSGSPYLYCDKLRGTY